MYVTKRNETKTTCPASQLVCLLGLFAVAPGGNV